MSIFHRIAGTVIVALTAGCASTPPAAPEASSDPGMLIVRGGRFTMGHDTGELNERPAHKVELDTYAMDRTEVSARDFAEFLNAEGNPGESYFTPNDHATVVLVQSERKAREILFAARPGYENYPANNVSWQGADAYCRWRGKRLPTEAEWEKAARGTDKRLFPWGKSTPREGLAQFEQTWQDRQFDVLVPVDALPDGASPYGQLNMAGNVLEWVNDWYRQNLCDFCNPDREGNLSLIRQLTGQDVATGAAPADAEESDEAGDTGSDTSQQRQAPPRNNPTGPETGIFKVLRGGSWQDHQDQELAATHRFWLDPTQRFPNTGFRCTKDAARQPGSRP